MVYISSTHIYLVLLFGHIGITIGIFQLIEKYFPVKVDYRLVIFASLLPDIIDKLIGRVILPIGSGRLIGHTLLFVLILTLISVRRKNLLPLPVASFIHLLEDQMWMYPTTLFWPLLNNNFSLGKRTSFQEYITELLKQYEPSLSYTFISEVIGFIIILTFLKKKMRGKLNA